MFAGFLNGAIVSNLETSWLKLIRLDECLAQITPSRVASIVVPRRFDVLFGRGETISQHTGNQRAFHIVEMNRERYECASKFEKTQISDRIVPIQFKDKSLLSTLA
jgi:hypothetical protein